MKLNVCMFALASIVVCASLPIILVTFFPCAEMLYSSHTYAASLHQSLQVISVKQTNCKKARLPDGGKC